MFEKKAPARDSRRLEVDSRQPASDSNESAPSQRVTLRPYQIEAIQDIRAAFMRGARRVLRQGPTGSGKGEEIGYMADRGAARGRRVVIIVHRVELIDQVQRALGRQGVRCGVIAPGFSETDELAQIASVATLARPKRLEQ